MRTTLLATALSLGLLSGCSNNRPAADARPPESAGMPAPTAPAEPKPAPGGANEPTNGTPSPASASAVYFVRDSGIRCIAPPCPAFIATRADKADDEGMKITDLDLSALNLTQEQRDRLLEASHTAPGIKVEASIANVPNAGPAGAATHLHITRVIEGK